MSPIEGHHPTVLAYAASRKIAEIYDEEHEGLPLFKTDTRFIEDVLGGRPGRLLDLGCGTGRHPAHFARLGWRVTGLDLSPHMLARARARLEKEGLAADLVEGDLCDLDRFGDASFDAAIAMFSTLGILATPALRRRALAEAARVLAPGGVFCCHVHNRLHNLRSRGGWTWVVRCCASRLFGRARAGDEVMRDYQGVQDLYLHTYTAGELVRLVRGAELGVERLMPLDEDRTGPLRGPFATVRANGFLLAARKPRQGIGRPPTAPPDA